MDVNRGAQCGAGAELLGSAPARPSAEPTGTRGVCGGTSSARVVTSPRPRGAGARTRERTRAAPGEARGWPQGDARTRTRRGAAYTPRTVYRGAFVKNENGDVRALPLGLYRVLLTPCLRCLASPFTLPRSTHTDTAARWEYVKDSRRAGSLG